MLRPVFKKLGQELKEENGQMAILLAMMIVVLLGFLSLTVDIGYAYVQKRFTQNAADAGARAGARAITNEEYENVTSQIQSIAEENLMGEPISTNINILYANDPAGPWYSGPPNTGTRLIRVEPQITFETFFAPILGINTITVSAVSASTIYNTDFPSSWSMGIFPLGIPFIDYSNYVAGQTYSLWDPSAHKGPNYQYYNTPAWWKGILNMSNDPVPSHKIPNIENWSTYTYQGTIFNGDELGLYSGDAGNNLANGLRTFIQIHPRNDSQGLYSLIALPLFNYYDSGLGKVTISGFAMFKLYYQDVNSSSATGVFVKYFNSRGSPHTTETYTTFGPKTFKMTQ